ncbi:VOC family protein [Aestuariibius insulae]|uniref:VOC family protein n=1 Tax=Aestuariibius insulae TaxID=2058287 RepID=UPI00345E80E3
MTETPDRPSADDYQRDLAEFQETVSPLGQASPLVRTDRLDHVHLYVTDRAAALRWYKRVLGLAVYGAGHDDVAEDHPVFLAPGTGGAHCLSLFVGPRPDGGDRTVAFHASGRAFVQFAKALPSALLKGRDGTALTAGRHHDYGAALTFNFLDPAGNQLELVTYDVDEARAGLEALA